LKFNGAATAIALLLMFFSVGHLGGIDGALTSPNFYQQVRPILEQHCQSCHRAGEIAPFALVTYQDAKPWAAEILHAVEDHKMPPWFADPC
jgi:hypothetical protein